MDPISPALADAFHLLRMDLHRQLWAAEDLVDEDNDWSDEDIDAARKLIPDLVLIIRGLLKEHQVAPSGQCRICSSAWPCPVVTTIHALVKDPDNAYVELVQRVNSVT